MFRYLTYFILVFSICFVSCDENRVFERNIEFSDKTWLADSVVNIQFDIKDIKQSYNLYYNLRNTIAYPYHNIYVNYSLEDTLGRALRSDLVSTNLFHPKSGRPLGNGLGDVFDHQILLLEDFKFDKIGTYNFKIQQYMRKDSLQDILAVGMRIEKPEYDE